MIEVTQEDRIAAASLANDIGEHEIAQNILAGTRDRFTWVQHFARHRIAAEQRGMIAARDVAVAACMAERLHEPHDATDVSYNDAVYDCAQAIATMPMTAGGSDA